MQNSIWLIPLESLEFTYTPRDLNRSNRSRLDFFFISNHLIPIVGKIEIAQTLQSNLFDHKAVLLDFKKVRQGNSRPCISRKILDADHISTVVWGAILETYVLNSGLDREIQNGFQREIGRVITIYAPVNLTAPCIMIFMRASPLRGGLGHGTLDICGPL